MKTADMINTMTFPHPSALLPHGKPILQIDAILSYRAGKYLIAEKNIKDDNPFLEGHFPDYPLMPGVILIEMMFQTCGLYGRMEERRIAGERNAGEGSEGHRIADPGRETPKRMGKAIKINDAVFRMEVRPGSALKIKAAFAHKLLSFSVFHATITCGEKLVADAKITVHL